MTINGIEFEFDITDEKDNENYWSALANYDAKLPDLKKKEGPDIIRTGLQMVRDFFYDAVGIDVIANVTSLKKAFEHYNEFISAVGEQTKEFNEMMSNMTAENPDGASTPKKDKITRSVYPAGYMGARPPKK